MRTVGDATRLMTMSITDLLDDWFESEQVKAGLAINGVIGTWAGPDSPGTAYVMAHHSIGDVGDGHLGNWGFPEGGMGAVADTIRRSAEELGATVRTRAPVARVLVSGGRVTGVALRGGEELYAPVVVTAVHPKITFLEQLDRAELPDFTADPRHQGQRAPQRLGRDGAVAGLPRAGLPGRQAGPGRDAAVLRRLHPHGVRQDAGARGRPRHVAVHPVVPAPVGRGPHTEELEAYADQMIDCYAGLAPNLKGAILHREVIGPWQMEHEYGLVGGNIFHGELSADQLFHLRPAPGYADYRSPIAGLYHASSATHGGGMRWQRHGLLQPRAQLEGLWAAASCCHRWTPARPGRRWTGWPSGRRCTAPARAPGRPTWPSTPWWCAEPGRAAAQPWTRSPVCLRNCCTPAARHTAAATASTARDQATLAAQPRITSVRMASIA